MQFTTLSYFVFASVVFLLFHVTAQRWRWVVLLAASYLFYTALEAPYLVGLLLLVTGISYTCALRIGSGLRDRSSRRWLAIGCCSCLILLALIKYLPPLGRTSGLGGTGFHWSSALISVGVSYFTFQAVSYLVDVYLEQVEPERHFGRYALFLAFFPKLLQGPIERGADLLPQLRQQYDFDYHRFRAGLLLFCWGLFQKMVLADRFALYSDQVFENVRAYQGIPLILATYAYAFEIYFDFAGYTDMARGVAQTMGIQLTRNFNSPYLATSIADFWRRWHISFSRWILDYIFKPLQIKWRDWGQRGTAAALMVTFFISGLWHGATWGFLVWGLMHGTYLATSIYYRPYQKRLQKRLGITKNPCWPWWQRIFTFNLVCLSWVFFRCYRVSDAIYVISHSFSLNAPFRSFLLSHGVCHPPILVLSTLVAVAVKVSIDNNRSIFNCNRYFRYVLYLGLLNSIVYLAVSTQKTFLYAQF